MGREAVLQIPKVLLQIQNGKDGTFVFVLVEGDNYCSRRILNSPLQKAASEWETELWQLLMCYE